MCKMHTAHCSQAVDLLRDEGDENKRQGLILAFLTGTRRGPCLICCSVNCHTVVPGGRCRLWTTTASDLTGEPRP
jgi:hypothetical protein